MQKYVNFSSCMHWWVISFDFSFNQVSQLHSPLFLHKTNNNDEYSEA